MQIRPQRLMFMAILTVLLSICLGYVKEIYAQQSPLPAPTGPYAVGRTLFDWTDESRVDLESPKGYREIPVWLWYPATPASNAKPAEWFPGIWGEILAAIIAPRPNPGQPAPEKFPMNTILSHSFTDAPIATTQKKYPVLVFAPGLGGFPTQYSGLIEDLVSHGYIVAGIVPTYFSQYTVFSDGRVAGRHQTPGDVPGAPRFNGLTASMEPVYRIWTGDMQFTLNKLEKLNVDARSPLKGQIDFDRVGVFGHSFGGTASLQVLKDDARVRAAILMDGNIMGDVARNPIVPKALLFMSSGSRGGKPVRASTPDNAKPANTAQRDYRTLQQELIRNAKASYVMSISGTNHSFATDTGLMPYAMSSMRDANRARVLAITRAYIKAFFDQHLLGKNSLLLNGSSPDYPEVTIEKF
jgi:dienelactone hydrolase